MILLKLVGCQKDDSNSCSAFAKAWSFLSTRFTKVTNRSDFTINFWLISWFIIVQKKWFSNNWNSQTNATIFSSLQVRSDKQLRFSTICFHYLFVNKWQQQTATMIQQLNTYYTSTVSTSLSEILIISGFLTTLIDAKKSVIPPKIPYCQRNDQFVRFQGMFCSFYF